MRSGRVAAVGCTVVALTCSLFASGWQRFTWGARIGTFGCALTLLVAGSSWRHRHAGSASSGADATPPPAAMGGAAVWLAVIVVAAVWDILALFTPPDLHHLTLSAIELAYRPLHALLFACWLAIGWVLAVEPVRRSRR